MDNIKAKYDRDRDGEVTEQEIERVRAMLEIELQEEKAQTQRRMAWVAMISMLIFTVTLFSPLVGDSRVEALADLLGLFFIAQAGIVGAYMGVTAWMTSSRSSSRKFNASDYQQYASRRHDDGE